MNMLYLEPINFDKPYEEMCDSNVCNNANQSDTEVQNEENEEKPEVEETFAQNVSPHYSPHRRGSSVCVRKAFSLNRLRTVSAKCRARPGFEPGTTRTLSGYHTPRPTSHDIFCLSF